MKRITIMLAAMLFAIGLMAAPASAHVLVVDSAGNGHDGVWVGGPVGVPGQGQGLVLGGPDGQQTMPPSHVKGLNSACDAIREKGNGKAAADIWGPPHPNTCNHG
jgi:hypothetical protein